MTSQLEPAQQTTVTTDESPRRCDDPTPDELPAETLSTPSIASPGAPQDSDAHSHILKNVRMSKVDAIHARRPTEVLADAKRYRKRAQAAEAEVEQLKNQLAEREKSLADLNQAAVRERNVRSLEKQLREAGAIDLDAAMALAERSLNARPNASEDDINQTVAELQRMRPWLFRAAASQNAPAQTGVMSAAAAANGVPSRAVKIERAAGEAIATGARTDLLRYLRLRRPRRR